MVALFVGTCCKRRRFPARSGDTRISKGTHRSPALIPKWLAPTRGISRRRKSLSVISFKHGTFVISRMFGFAAR